MGLKVHEDSSVCLLDVELSFDAFILFDPYFMSRIERKSSMSGISSSNWIVGCSLFKYLSVFRAFSKLSIVMPTSPTYL